MWNLLNTNFSITGLLFQGVIGLRQQHGWIGRKILKHEPGSASERQIRIIAMTGIYGILYMIMQRCSGKLSDGKDRTTAFHEDLVSFQINTWSPLRRRLCQQEDTNET